jgi:hypothetical protein
MACLKGDTGEAIVALAIDRNAWLGAVLNGGVVAHDAIDGWQGRAIECAIGTIESGLIE